MWSKTQLHQTGRIILFSAGLGLILAAGGYSPANATGSTSSPQPISNADANHGGANGQCPGGAYCSTRDGSPSLNGNGTGKATGKPCAGCVGKADNKNPKGQRPDGSDHNAGYECDRNHGVGRSNPAHTGCAAAVTPTPPKTCTDQTPKNCQPGEKPTGAGTPPGVVASPVAGTSTAPGTTGVLVSPAEGVAAALNPLPTAAGAGQVDTSDQLAAGGFAGFAALLALGAGFVLRRRQSRA
jgi:MYXO-CTERM domain-containing protein